MRTGSGSEDEIRAELNAGRPVILEVPGHWIAAVGLDGDQILINDPFYRDRKTLDVYKGKVRSSVHYEPSSDLVGRITAPGTGSKGDDTEARSQSGMSIFREATDASINPGASRQATAWRTQTHREAPPREPGQTRSCCPAAR